VFVIFFADYLDKLHRRGNKLILVHSIELPELTLHNASKSCLLFVVICVMHYLSSVVANLFINIWCEIKG